MTQAKPHRVVLDVDVLEEMRERLKRVRLLPDLGPGWQRGVPTAWLRTLVQDWAAFDTAAFQDQLDGLVHLRAEFDGQSVHAVHVVGRGPDPIPLLLTHGWPGSFLEYLPILSLLCDPAAHGGDPADAFTVVVPSLPGFGFSGPPPENQSRRDVAHLWHRLMTEGLGHDRYVAHGSDLGAGVTAWLARDHPHAVAAIHLATPGLAVPPGPRSAAEDAFASASQSWTAEEGGYAHQHSTKPTTIAAALHDSPAGLAAWIGEKVVAWSSTLSDGAPAYDRELMLASLTLYWVTGTITSSMLPYWAHQHSPNLLPVDDPSPVPTAVTIFGGEMVPFPKPPRSLAERYFALMAWAEHPFGGHFPAVAAPELLARTLRETLLPAAQSFQA